MVLLKIRDGVDEHEMWLYVKAILDSWRRNVANVIVRILQPESSEQLYLLHTD